MIYTYSKNHCNPCFYSGDIAKYPISDWTIYTPHFSILLGVVKKPCLYANAVVQPSVQHYSCYMAWKTKDHIWCRYYHLCINAPMWREKRWLQVIIDPPSYKHWTWKHLVSCGSWVIDGLNMLFHGFLLISLALPPVSVFFLDWTRRPTSG